MLIQEMIATSYLIYCFYHVFIFGVGRKEGDVVALLHYQSVIGNKGKGSQSIGRRQA